MPFDPSASRSGSVFSDVPNYAAAWVCYINGREVPILGFEVEYGVWQIPTFRIHCIPDVTIQRLGHEDRVPVQLFYLDEWGNDTPTFRLLVDGEIAGWSFSSSSGSRAIVFSCIANIHVFQQLYFFYMTNVDDIVASRSPEVLARGFTTPGLLYPYALFHQGLLTTTAQVDQTTPEELQRGTILQGVDLSARAEQDNAQKSTATIQAPYELVTNVIKGCISSAVPNDRRAVPMMNFFARYIRKTRFHNRWVRLPIFEDAATLANRQGVFPIFNAARNDQALIAMQRQVVSQVGSSGPVWNLFQQVLGLVYMDIAMIPNPACVQVSLADAGPNQPEEGKILRLLADRANTVTVRRGVDVQFILQRANAIADRLRSQLAAGTTLDPELLVEGGFASSPSTSAEIDTSQIYQAIYDRTANAAAQNGDTDRTTIDPLEPIRLAQYAVKPQFLFGEVPACNVIMPSMIDSWTYDESYINQPTRIYVNDSVMTRLLRAQGNNREFMLHALTVGFPEEADALMHHRVASSANEGAGGAAGATESGRNLLLWPEEYYKGPVTARAALPAWFQMLRQFSNSQGTGNDPTPNSPMGGQAAQTPANNVPITTRTVEIPRSTTYVNNANGNGSPAAPVIDETQPTYARRVPFGRTERVSLNGALAPRFWLRTGGGLDPANYVPAQQTALWPLPPPRTSNRRGRQTQGATTFERRSTVQKMAQMMRLLLPICRQAFSGLTEDQLFAVAFAVYWVSFNEQGVTGYVSWALGNQKQYDNSPVGHWTINPWQRQPYGAAASPQEGAQRHVNWLVSNQQMALRAMLTGRGSAEFNAFAASRGYTTNAFWQNFSPIRPDLYYIALGYGGYYGTENVSDPERRGEIGFARTRSQASFFTRIRALFQNNTIPADVVSTRPYAGAVYRPLIREEDRPLLNWGRPRAQETVVTRRIPRVAASGQTALPGTANAGANQPNRDASPGAAAQQTVQGPQDPTTTNAQESTEGDQFARLFRLYAQYEYLKQRYSQRNAGANLRFNPYLVPGFPAMLFDSMRTRMHCVGYVQNLSHVGFASSGGVAMSTTVRMSFCRTIHEFINDVRNDANRFAGRVTSAPAEIIDEIRVIIQDENRAEEFYQRFLYGGARPNRVPAVFRWDRALGYARGLDVEDIDILGESVETTVARQQERDAAVRAQVNEDSTVGAENTQPNPTSPNASAQAGGVASEGQQTVRHNLDPNEELSPNPRTVYADAFDNYHIAMQLASRPVCTLEQYIRFWHGGRTINDLLATGDVETPNLDFAYYNQPVNDVVATGQAGTEVRAQTSRSTAVYYERIFRLRPGPGPEPTAEQRGYTDPPNVQPSSTTAGVPANYPQTRADWDSVLTLYVQKVRRLLSPGT